MYIVFFFRMPGSEPKFYACAVCKKRTKPKERRHIIRKYLQNGYLLMVKTMK
jgi:hypothetical protein